MTPPPRELPSENTSGQVVRFVAFVADPAANVTDEDRSDQWEVLSVSQMAGGKDTIQLFRKLTVAGRMKNRTIAQLKPQKVEVWTVDDKGEKDQPIAWGEMDTRSMRLSGDETELATATIQGYHFGSPLRGMQVYDDEAADVFVVEHDAEFQPLVELRIIDNMMRQRDEANYPDYPLWYLPESTRTATAYNEHGEVSPSPWDLKSIVKTLQGQLNENQTSIENLVPSDDDFSAAPEIRNVRLPRGLYLNECLDAVLPPHGYGWHLAYVKDDSDRIQPRITAYKRGTGPKKKLPFPKIDGNANLTHSADQIDIVAGVGELANQIRLEGGIKQYEVTIELYRAWAEADDDADVADLTKSLDGADAFGPIWRKWVANEAGDYTDTRLSVKPIPSPRDFSDVFTDGYIVRRRRAMDCLTWQTDSTNEGTRRRPVLVEWADGSGFVPVKPEWGVRILEDEIGVIFTADEPPEDMMAAGDNCRLRITCTIEGDTRLTATATKESDHPNPATVEKVMDVSDQFHYRQRHANSVLTGAADTVDNTSKIEAQAAKLKLQMEAVALQSSIRLFGVHLDFAIGDIITELEGRAIQFNRLPEGRGERYLQVVGREFDVMAQRTTLVVSPYDK